MITEGLQLPSSSKVYTQVIQSCKVQCGLVQTCPVYIQLVNQHAVLCPSRLMKTFMTNMYSNAWKT